MQQSRDPRVFHHHVAAHAPQNRRARVNHDGIPVHDPRQQVTSEYDEGDAQAKAEDEEREAALGGGGDGQDVVDGHRDVGDKNEPYGLP